MGNKWDKSEEGKAYHAEYNKKNQRSNIQFRRDSGIPEAIADACLAENISQAEYLRKAVKNRLKREGFIK